VYSSYTWASKALEASWSAPRVHAIGVQNGVQKRNESRI